MMGAKANLPIAGILLALVTFVALLLFELDPAIATAICILWVGTLLLAVSRPPDMTRTKSNPQLNDESVQKLIENSATPLLITKQNKVVIANGAARKLLGTHVVGQDTRVTFRQPAAISLLSDDRSGQATLRGLVRRNDIWQINRQAIDDGTAVIELTNQTAEADLSRAHTDFVANASHELRTPLASILGYVETLRESGDNLDSPTSQKFLGTIEREGQRLQSLISDLMSLSRVEAEKHDLPETQLDIADLTKRAASDAAGPERRELLEFDIQTAPSVQGDQQQLEQVVRNLVDNAFKYGHPETPVSVVLDEGRNNMARITVTNQGEGIAPEHIPHLTRRFYRTDPGRSRASGGTGLGLAIVKHIVERHRGRLEIESELGVGTTVTVRLPDASQ